ncbi:MAG: hypothetical protein Q4D04_01765 [Clostridia bacterium]|nr:hypothetical protein [Clostridia bacterium]
MKKILTLVLVLALTVCPIAYAQGEETQLLVAAAVRDVTPTIENGLLPIPGIGRDAGPIVDVIDPLRTRVIALQSGDSTALIVCTETGKGPTGWQFAKALSEHTGVPVEAIFYTTTHSHSAPELKTEITLEPVEGEEVDNKTLWGRYVLEQMCSAADEALANLKPATAGIGYSESYINTNRNRTYISRADGTTYRELGYNPTGISDKTLVVVRFDDLDGNPIAYIVNYPVHAVTMIANTYFDGQTGVSSDIPGHVSTLLEEQNPGSVAVWTSGAAGDQNPIASNQVMYPDPETGDLVTEYTGEVKIMEYLANIHYADILTAIESIAPVAADDVAFAEGITSIPNEEGSEEAEFALHLKVLRIGDIAFVGSPAELYTSIGMYMKENSIIENTIVVNHTWTQEEAYNGYVLDDDARVNGGYGGGRLVYKTGYVNDALADLMNSLLEETLS